MLASTYQSAVRIITTVKYTSNNLNFMHLVVLEIYTKGRPDNHQTQLYKIMT